MEFNFNKPFLQLDKQPYKENGEVVMLNIVLAKNLITQLKGDAYKLLEWGQKLHDKGILELDKSDQIMLRGLIENFENMFAIARAQLLAVIDNYELPL